MLLESNPIQSNESDGLKRVDDQEKKLAEKITISILKIPLNVRILNSSKAFINRWRKLASTNAEKQANLDYMEGLACWYNSDFSEADKHFKSSLLKFKVFI